VAAVGGNITDLSTRLSGGLYLLTAEVDLPADADVAALQQALAGTAEGLGVRATLRELESDQL
jgi:glycine cleavage system transcriptional repressor